MPGERLSMRKIREVQREGLSLASLEPLLLGRRHGHCHCGELGEALRLLGFVRRRNWRGADGFPAVWSKRTECESRVEEVLVVCNRASRVSPVQPARCGFI
jgi:hypothetical protein